MTLTTVVPSFYHCIMVAPSMHKNDPNRQTNLLLGVGCFGFLSRSLRLVELFCSPLCSDLFLSLQANFGLKHMQKNHFLDARRQSGHHSITAGSIGARERILTLSAHKEGPYHDRPLLCPFRLSPLLTCSGSTIAFLKILKIQGPNPKI